MGKKRGNMAGIRDGAAENGNQRGTATVVGTETETGVVKAMNGDSAIRNMKDTRQKREELGKER